MRMDSSLLSKVIPVVLLSPLSTVQLDTDVSPDHFLLSQDVHPPTQDITQPPAGPDPAPGPSSLPPAGPDPAQGPYSLPTARPDPVKHSSVPADPSPYLHPAYSSPAIPIETSAPPPPDSQLFEQRTIAQDSQLSALNAARQLKDFPPINDPDALVDSFLEDFLALLLMQRMCFRPMILASPISKIRSRMNMRA